MRCYRDIYRGFEIDYGPDQEGYAVYLAGKLMIECSSYEDACAWVDSYHKVNGLALGLRILNV